MTTQQFEALEVPTNQLVVSPINVRRNVGDISELADSIREHGILEPLVVRPTSDGNYEVIIGSRRLAAASQLNLDVVPVVVQRISDAEAVIRSLVENLQRGDLSLDERVEAYKRIEEYARFSSRAELARAIGRQRNRIEQDFEAYEAMTILRPRGVDVVSRLSPSTPQRRSGEAIPERHATLLGQTMSAVRGVIPEEKIDDTYAELARAIAPLEHDRARRLLDNFKMYPERPTSEIVSMTLSTVQREITLPADTARQLEEIAAEQGQTNLNDTIIRLVKAQREAPPVLPDYLVSDEQTFSGPGPVESDGQEMLPWDLPVAKDGDSQSEEKPTGYRGVELPQDSVQVQHFNKGLWNLMHSVSSASADFYTVGYSGKNIEQFIKVLRAADVSTVVDIRSAPVSQYKPDFSKDNLRSHLLEHGISYDHRPNLGVPSNIRQQAAQVGDREEIWEWYKTNVIGKLSDAELTQLTNYEGTIAFMCVEIDPESCHRHLVFLELERMGLRGQDL